MTIYRIYTRTGSDWLPVCIGDYSYIPKEWTTLQECRQAFQQYVADEKATRQKQSEPGEGLWVVPFAPRQYKIVAIPTADLEVFDAPHPPPVKRAPAAEPDHRRPARADAAPAGRPPADPGGEPAPRRPA